MIKHFGLHSWYKIELWEIVFGITAGLLLLEFFIRTPRCSRRHGAKRNKSDRYEQGTRARLPEPIRSREK